MEFKQDWLTKFQLTENNPYENGITKELYVQKITDCNCEYVCFSEEIGEDGTFHIHAYLKLRGQKRFKTIKKIFPRAHIEIARGSSSANRDYIFKEGKWADSTKVETNIKDSHYEFGECPPDDTQGKRNDLVDLYQCVNEGMTDVEIMEYNPRLAVRLTDMQKIRQTLLAHKYKTQCRQLHVLYVYGPTGTGKTSSIFKKHGYDDVYRVTDYKHPFDGYKCESVIVFEEFRSQLKIEDMLNYLDVYPLTLPCRFVNQQACYSTVYIVSNWTLKEQYKNIQDEYPLTYKAFLRRIHSIFKHQIDRMPIDESKTFKQLGFCLNESLPFKN